MTEVDVEYAVAFADRVGATTGLRHWDPRGAQLFALYDGELGYSAEPVAGGFALHLRNRGGGGEIGVASHVDDVLRLLAIDVGWTAEIGLMRWGAPRGFAYEEAARGVVARWEDRSGAERAVSVRGGSNARDTALKLGTWALKDLDEIVDLVEEAHRRREERRTR
ncbi:hypothetical protein [Microbacterium karelineae]|uniref:hypothetical protein n=1 Tax=Microbacterium karelineae TaxID=2654283 RepID=UPI0012EAF028|nr:hypothetical protein [Microbacterium karelineae]